MLERFRFYIRHVLFNLRGGFLVRPLIIALGLGLIGCFLSTIEVHNPAVSEWVPKFFFPTHSDPQVAQVILSTIAGAVMTVVSIVFAILLMSLTLASTQFSPRILNGFSKDVNTQRTLGIFLGTFSYCVSALPAAHTKPEATAPIVTVLGAMFLGLLCVAWLLYFIHHISQAISVNFIVDRIAVETEVIIKSQMPDLVGAQEVRPKPMRITLAGKQAVMSSRSGYIRYVDFGNLVKIATERGATVELCRRLGHFVPAGAHLVTVRGALLDAKAKRALNGCFDLGPTRTLEDDIEFGILQIVDIALRAISPAVNDPSTGVTCVDQLSRLLIQFVQRKPACFEFADDQGVIRVIAPKLEFDRLIHSAFQQIQYYSKSDLAVSMRLLRALDDIGSCISDPGQLQLVKNRGRDIFEACAPNMSSQDLDDLKARLVQLEALEPSNPRSA